MRLRHWIIVFLTMKSSKIVWMFFVIGTLALAAPSQGEAQTCWRQVSVDTIADHTLPNDPWYNQGSGQMDWIKGHSVEKSGDQYLSRMQKWTGVNQSSWLVNIREARGEYNQADGSKASVIWGTPPQLWCSGQQFMLSAQLGAQRTGRSHGFVFYYSYWVGDDGRLHPAAPFRELGPPAGRHPLAVNSGSRIEIDTLYYNEQSTRGSITVVPVADPKLKEWGLTVFMGMNSNDDFSVHYHYQLVQAGPNPPVPQSSPNPPPRGCGLGVRWNETESGFNGTWTKRWGTNVFDAAWGGIRAVLTMSLQGNTVSIARRQSTDGVNCDYTGTIAADGVTVTGTYRCPPQYPNPMPWRATIICYDTSVQ
jgi:hypothetical protein